MIKKILAVVLALLMVLGMIACGTTEKPAEQSPANTEQKTDTAPGEQQGEAAAAEQGESAAAAEEKEPEPFVSKVVRDDSVYVNMTMAELYEEAKKEVADGHQLVVYSETGSTAKSVAKFQEAYPEIQVECTKLKTNAIAEKIKQEYEGNPYCDIVITSDGSGAIYEEWYSKGYVVAYYPASIEADLNEEYTPYGLPITLEADIWFYSTAAFPNGSPINNWWDAVEMDENGKSKYTVVSHEASNLNMASTLANLVKNADKLEAAYKEKYGTDIEYTYPADSGVEPNNAGYEWLYRFLQCDHIYTNDSDEILEIVDKSTAEEPVLGYGSGIKLGDALELGRNVDYVTTMSQFNGFARAKFVLICTKSDNPAAARLFALYSLGGEDGQGDGYNAYVNRMGSYPTRKSRDASEFNPKYSYADLNLLPTDLAFVNYNYLDVQDFWTYYSDVFKK